MVSPVLHFQQWLDKKSVILINSALGALDHDVNQKGSVTPYTFFIV